MHRLAFFGTSAFAVPLLRALLQDARFSVSVVVTQPDRPVGRKQTLTPPPVKEVAMEHGLPVLQPERLRAPESVAALTEHTFDAAVVASYGQILPQTVLDLASQRFINLHGSILPKYRGASPIAEAIKQGDAETGITVMLMDADMDHGDTLAFGRVPITSTDTTQSLEVALANLGATLLPDVLAEYLVGQRTATPQDHEHATFCGRIKKEHGLIDPLTVSAEALERLVRAYTPWPLVTIETHGTRAKLLSVHVGSPKPGELAIPCQEGVLIVDECRPEGGKTMTGEAFARGRSAQ